ncbi:uncharacterized protein SCODWIG_03324 [Saccharomycodes ludwigii]|uniref:ORC6 first cyclin-like domain-containing protein n=1 Tax=Saccharomycodes ludwigii TaxID=36035 RepID=A0A376BA60_9ASCO|nr:hypothetical protein SCDLUD_002883 [Saccharomycodes ludwigii]KAH3901391.1 hypothetical protein SCDLUD_002883 [Saccharomycodes ludwigii]SSD61563.1 uncharacterized protein SCODWIG_03324 [Saccharomycodes ludwigii]
MASIIDQSIADLLKKSRDEINWKDPNFIKLHTATTTIYNLSLTKLPHLKPDESVARCHIAALLSLEKLKSKYPDLNIEYSIEKIPVAPKKLNKIVQMFKENILNISPVKQKIDTLSGLDWFSDKSPVKRKVNDMLSMSPMELRERLFDEDVETKNESSKKRSKIAVKTKKNESIKALITNATPTRIQDGTITSMLNYSSSPMKETMNTDNKSATATPRRKLAFELADLPPSSPIKNTANYINNNESSIQTKNDVKETVEKEPFEEADEKIADSLNSKSCSDVTANGPVSKTKKNVVLKSLTLIPYLEKKYVKFKPKELMDICNIFEIPYDEAMCIIDFILKNTNYLIHAYKMLCGTILLCCRYIFAKERKKNIKADEIILSKMKYLLKCEDTAELFYCCDLMQELLEGEKWFKDLKLKYGINTKEEFEQQILIRRGSMLQHSKAVVSDEEYESWKNNILTDLHLRDGA